MVILANQDHRQVPERSHVEGLKELALVRSPISIQSKCDSLILRVLLPEGNTTTKRNLGSNDTMAAIELSVLLVEMHRPTLTLGAPSAAAHELG